MLKLREGISKLQLVEILHLSYVELLTNIPTNRQATVIDPLGEAQAWHGLSYWFGEPLVDSEQNDEYQ